MTRGPAKVAGVWHETDSVVRARALGGRPILRAKVMVPALVYSGRRLTAGVVS